MLEEDGFKGYDSHKGHPCILQSVNSMFNNAFTENMEQVYLDHREYRGQPTEPLLLLFIQQLQEYPLSSNSIIDFLHHEISWFAGVWVTSWSTCRNIEQQWKEISHCSCRIWQCKWLLTVFVTQINKDIGVAWYWTRQWLSFQSFGLLLYASLATFWHMDSELVMHTKCPYNSHNTILLRKGCWVVRIGCCQEWGRQIKIFLQCHHCNRGVWSRGVNLTCYTLSKSLF